MNVVFANIGQQAVRRVARETFEHLLNLDLKFHLARQTGGLTRAIDRGTKFVTHFDSIVQFLNVTYQGYHIHAPGHHFPYLPDCPGDIYGLRNTCEPRADSVSFPTHH